MAGAAYTGIYGPQVRTAPKPRQDILATAAPSAAPPTVTAPKPTFQPPAPVAADPRVAALTTELAQSSPRVTTAPNHKLNDLIAQMEAQIASANTARAATQNRAAELSAPITIAAPDFSAQQAERQKLNALISELMAGRGPAIGDVTADPAAQAYSLQKRRAAERLRETAANRLGASGVSGRGEFDTEVLGINEAAGEDIAQFSANLANQRRGEALQSALSGAQLSLSALDRQAQQERDRFESQLALEDRRRAGILSQSSLEESGAASNLDALQRLYAELAGQDARAEDLAFRQQEADAARKAGVVNTLTGQQAQAQGVKERADEVARSDAERRLRDELLAIEVANAKRRAGGSGTARVGGRGAVVPSYF